MKKYFQQYFRIMAAELSESGLMILINISNEFFIIVFITSEKPIVLYELEENIKFIISIIINIENFYFDKVFYTL